MCGISGFWGPDSAARVARMKLALRHRGPDGDGTWSGGSLSLGHTRLAIQDLSERGRQPMTAEDGSVVITVNGEIYNYRALRHELESLGAAFRSECDSEVVIHAWTHWGFQAFARFNGMFAIALYDRSTSTLLLARDRLGIKPLYYTRRSEGFAFASEIKGLFAGFDDRAWKLDAMGLAQYLVYANTFAERGFFEGVQLLRPGEILEFSEDGTQRSQTFWSREETLTRETMGFDTAVDDWRRVLDQSVERHLLSDVPVASYLSAGYDSASVACRAGHLGPEPPVCFTGTFAEGGWYDESTVAAQIAAANGSQHEAVSIGPADVSEALDAVVRALDEPRMGMGALPQYLVAQAVAKTHKVVLTGHGGDELFSGYPVFKAARFADGLRHCRPGILKELTGIRVSEMPHLAYFAASLLGPADRRHYLPVLHSLRSLAGALRPEIFEELQDLQPWEALMEFAGAHGSHSEQVFNTYLHTYLHGLLVVEDRISMAHSLESRTPLLDNAMLELSLTVPSEIKLDRGRLKAIVKSGAETLLPRVLASQPKRGFPTPLRHWLRGPLVSLLEDRLGGPGSHLRALFRPEWLQSTVSGYLRSPLRSVRPLDEIRSHRIWQLLCLESWLRQCEEVWGIRVVDRPGVP